MSIVQPWALADTLSKQVPVVQVLEHNATFVNLQPKCEPQLGKRGLYGSVGGASDAHSFQMALLWVLNYSDGAHCLLDIAERASMPFAIIAEAAAALRATDLLSEVSAFDRKDAP
jgi:aminopeptidase-like protein